MFVPVLTVKRTMVTCGDASASKVLLRLRQSQVALALHCYAMDDES